jgi:hypothetical protein
VFTATNALSISEGERDEVDHVGSASVCRFITYAYPWLRKWFRPSRRC